MWKRFVGDLGCPICYSRLELKAIEESRAELRPADYSKGEGLGIDTNELDVYVDTGILLCDACNYWFPVIYGLPVLLPYETPITKEFVDRYQGILQGLAKKYSIPGTEPRPGEQFVLKSFSKEWLEYDYDGVIWGWSYEDREKTLLSEIGPISDATRYRKFLEIGCGVGVTTHFAEKDYNSDAVGVDLSLSVLKATEHFKDNPFLHFLQASLFQLPLKKDGFDLIYSHGVLHHTYSTEEAFRKISSYCRPGGMMYIWVYGKEGLRSSWDRRIGHQAERVLRPITSRMPTIIATVILSPLAIGYIMFNTILRKYNPTLQAYNYHRAMHAARDRFTPRYAHRHNYGEVMKWYEEMGFKSIERVDWKKVPDVVQNLFRGSVGVRGIRNPD